MRLRPTASGWVDHDSSTTPEWDVAQLKRLARQLGYALVWAPIDSVVPLVDLVRVADVDAFLCPAPDLLDTFTLHALMCVVQVETACPRMSFAPWAAEEWARENRP